MRLLRAHTGRTSESGVEAILTFPARDDVGDYVKPDGGRWVDPHPVVNWTHACPIGRAEYIELKSITDNGETHNVYVGKTDFFKSRDQLKGVDRTRFNNPIQRKPVGQYSVDDVLTVARQAERLVKAGEATGVSIEFSPDGPKGEAFWDLPEYCDAERRPARHFEKWIGYTYAHARQQINPGCMTLKSVLGDEIHPLIKATSAHPLAVRALQASQRALKRTNRGYFERGAKSLQHFTEVLERHAASPYSSSHDHEMASADHMRVAQIHSKYMSHGEEDPHARAFQAHMKAADLHREAARSYRKALPESFEGPLVYGEMPGASEPSAGARAMLNFAQYLVDGAVALERDIQQSDSPEYHAEAKRAGEVAKNLAAELNNFVIKSKAMLTGAEAPELKAELDLTADGVIICKAYMNWRPRRFSKSEVKPAVIDTSEHDKLKKELAEKLKLLEPYTKALLRRQ